MDQVVAALLRALSQRGPNMTLFRASPKATFMYGARHLESNEGWWVVFAADLVITERATSIELRFTPSGTLHRGEPWSWDLVLMPGNQLELRDHATYPDPWGNFLSYRAMKLCRDELVHRVASNMGQQIDQMLHPPSTSMLPSTWFGSLAGPASEPVGLGGSSAVTAPPAPPRRIYASEPLSEAEVDTVWRPVSQGFAASRPAGADSASGYGTASPLGQRAAVPAERAASPQAAGRLVGAASHASPHAMPRGYSTPANSAEAFNDGYADSEDLYAGAGADAARSSIYGAHDALWLQDRSDAASALAPSHASRNLTFDEKLDVLRSAMPHQSSEFLRQLLNREGGDLGSALASNSA